MKLQEQVHNLKQAQGVSPQKIGNVRKERHNLYMGISHSSPEVTLLPGNP